MQLTVVDDDSFVIERIRRSLRGTNWQVQSFHSADAALAFFRGEKDSSVWPCDALIVDQRMPAMDGDEFIAELAEARDLCQLPVFLASTVLPPDAIREKLQAFGVVVLDKEVFAEPSELLELLDPDRVP